MVSVSADSEMRELVWRARHLIELETAMMRMFPFVLLRIRCKENDPDTPSEVPGAGADERAIERSTTAGSGRSGLSGTLDEDDREKDEPQLPL